VASIGQVHACICVYTTVYIYVGAPVAAQLISVRAVPVSSPAASYVRTPVGACTRAQPGPAPLCGCAIGRQAHMALLVGGLLQLQCVRSRARAAIPEDLRAHGGRRRRAWGVKLMTVAVPACQVRHVINHIYHLYYSKLQIVLGI
jgi:hypothetical protein